MFELASEQYPGVLIFAFGLVLLVMVVIAACIVDAILDRRERRAAPASRPSTREMSERAALMEAHAEVLRRHVREHAALRLVNRR